MDIESLVTGLAEEGRLLNIEQYFDANGTTPVMKSVQRVMDAVHGNVWGNASSSSPQGKLAHKALEMARETIAELLHTDPSTIIFTSGATESANALLRNQVHVVTTAGEHACVRIPVKHIKRTIVPLTRDGAPELSQWEKAVRQRGVSLAVAILINNETGAIAPWKSMADACAQAGIPLACDATQVPGKYPLLPHAMGCHYVFFSAHKFGGPKGVGVLWKHPDAANPFFQEGGAQESQRRAGTENVAGIVGMALALQRVTEDLNASPKKAVKLWRARVKALQMLRVIQGIVIHGPDRNMAYTTLSFALPNEIDSRLLLNDLSAEGWSFNVGSACSKGKRSAVLEAMGIPEEIEGATVRISMLPMLSGGDQLPVLIRRIVQWYDEHVESLY